MGRQRFGCPVRSRDQTDKDNQALRNQIIELRENISILNDRISNMEQRMKLKDMIKVKGKDKGKGKKKKSYY